MRRRMAIVAFAVALSLASLTAGSAVAAGPINLREGLRLTENGKPVPWGGTVENEQLIIDGYCHDDSPGKLLNNNDPIDVIQLDAPNYTSCEHGSVSGGIRLVALSDNGTALLWTAPTLTLTTPGPCVYEFSLLQGEFPAGGEYGKAYITGEALGGRGPGSSPSCARTLHTEFAVAELSPTDELLFTELTNSPTY